MVSEKCLQKGFDAVKVLNDARKIADDAWEGDSETIEFRLKENKELEQYKDDINDILKTMEEEFEEDVIVYKKSFLKGVELQNKIIKEAFETVVECEK